MSGMHFTLLDLGSGLKSKPYTKLDRLARDKR